MLVLCMPRNRFRAFLDQENSSPQNWGFRDGIPNSLPSGGMGSLKSELGQFSPSGANLPNGFMKFVFPHVGMDIKAASNAF